MLQSVPCPHCGRLLAVDAAHRGAAVACPICRQSFIPDEAGDAPPPEPARPVEVIPEEPPPRPRPHSPGRDFAERAGIDVDEEHHKAADSQRDALGRLAEWKEHMPEVPSAYRPSGVLPLTGAVSLAAGTLAGAVGSAAAFVAVGGVTAGLTIAIFALLDWIGKTCGRVLCALVVLGAVVGLVGAALTYAAQGWTAAAITTSFGRLGKNRNTAAAVLFSIAACLLGLGLSHVAGLWLTVQVLDWVEPGWAAQPAQPAQEAPPAWPGWLWLGIEVVGSLIAVVCAGFMSRQIVHESKFCEDCNEYMKEENKRGLDLGPTRALTQALRESQFDAAADLLHEAGGQVGVPSLYWCGQCGRGYVEVMAKFKCTWTSGDESQEKSEEWLAASAELLPEEVELFRRRPLRRRDADDADD